MYTKNQPEKMEGKGKKRGKDNMRLKKIKISIKKKKE